MRRIEEKEVFLCMYCTCTILVQVLIIIIIIYFLYKLVPFFWEICIYIYFWLCI